MTRLAGRMAELTIFISMVRPILFSCAVEGAKIPLVLHMEVCFMSPILIGTRVYLIMCEKISVNLRLFNAWQLTNSLSQTHCRSMSIFISALAVLQMTFAAQPTGTKMNRITPSSKCPAGP